MESLARVEWPPFVDQTAVTGTMGAGMPRINRDTVDIDLEPSIAAGRAITAQSARCSCPDPDRGTALRQRRHGCAPFRQCNTAIVFMVRYLQVKVLGRAEEYECASSSSASRISAKPFWRPSLRAATGSWACSVHPRRKAPRPTC